MNDQDLLDEMQQLAEAEDQQRMNEKRAQTQTFTHVQGQIAGLVHVLRSKGILSAEDVKTWEQKSEHISSLMNALIQLDIDRAEATTAEEVLSATRAALITAKDLAVIMGGDGSDIDKQLDALEQQWVAYQKEHR